MLSEELAFEAVSDISNELLAEHGISDRYTPQDLLSVFVGQNFRGILTSLQSKYGFTLPAEKVEALVKEEENRVVAKLEAKGRPCAGSIEQLDKLAASNKYTLTVVSSSALRRVIASIRKTGQDKYFGNRVYSAASSLPVPTTKPDPAIYLHAVAEIHKQAGECVAVEDSKSGVLSAVRAGVPVIAYVGCYETPEKQKEMADLLLAQGAKIVMYHWSDIDSALAQMEALPDAKM